ALDELVMRVRALLRRGRQTDQEIITAGDLAIDVGQQRVTRKGVELQFEPKELALLIFFTRHPGEVFSVETLIRRVWTDSDSTSAEAVRNYIARLRKKVGGCIENVRGSGYYFCSEA